MYNSQLEAGIFWGFLWMKFFPWDSRGMGVNVAIHQEIGIGQEKKSMSRIIITMCQFYI